MRNPDRPLRSFKIKYKLVFCYWPVVTFLVVLAGIAFYFSASQTVREQSISIVEQMSGRLANEIAQRMRTCEEILDSITADDGFLQYAEGRYTGPSEEYRLHKQFTARMEAVLAAMDAWIYLSVIRYDESLNESLSGRYHHKFADSLQITTMSSNFQLVNRRQLSGRAWFDTIYGSSEIVRGLWEQVEEDSQTGSITLFHELQSMDLLSMG
ncbi:MAG: hypothetical protein HFG26_12740 [Provencibacterium sp.]|jgi:hypothetical protein|nr:hypothetical protein [Provencibacterium sp.]